MFELPNKLRDKCVDLLESNDVPGGLITRVLDQANDAAEAEYDSSLDACSTYGIGGYGRPFTRTVHGTHDDAQADAEQMFFKTVEDWLLNGEADNCDDPLTASYLAYCDECEGRNDYYRQIESGVGL